jgi:hypothetical protein
VNVPEYRAVSDDANALQAAMAEALTLHCKGLTYRRKRGDAVEEPEGPEPTVMEEEEEKESEEEEEEEIIIVKLTEKEEEIDLKLVADTATAIAALGDEPVAGYTVWAKANGFPWWPAQLVTLEGMEPRAMKNGPGRERQLAATAFYTVNLFSTAVSYGCGGRLTAFSGGLGTGQWSRSGSRTACSACSLARSPTVKALSGRLSAFSVSHSKSVSYSDFVWAAHAEQPKTVVFGRAVAWIPPGRVRHFARGRTESLPTRREKKYALALQAPPHRRAPVESLR